MTRLLLLALLLAFSTPYPLTSNPSSASYARALPGYRWNFPRDDASHPRFATEWWYFTGNLASSSGRLFGFELTFFRVSPDYYFTHFTITDVAGRRFEAWERARRGDWVQAGASEMRPPPETPQERREAKTVFTLWNENWRADFDASGPRHLHAVWDGQALDLALVPGPRMLNGLHGWSQKGSAPGEASYYYSFPHIAASGTIQGVPAAGLVWMDHEFATDELAPNQQGWDWMGVHLAIGDLMLFNLRLTNGGRDPHSAGTWLPRNGQPVPLVAADFQMTPVRWWHKYPVAWRVAVPKLGLAFTVSAELDDQEVHAPALGVNYWEGAVSISTGGQGYLELTGYGNRFTLLQ